jgi:hypothetical protein
MKYGLMSGAAVLSALSALSALSPSVGRASGPTEMLVAVYVDPENAARWIVRYDNTGSRTGFLYSEDSGANFSLVCTTAFAASALRSLGSTDTAMMDSVRSSLSRNRMALVTGGGRTLVGTTSGAFIDDGNGCGAQRVNEIGGAWIGGLATTFDDPRVSYLITNGTSDAAGEGLWKRDVSGSVTKLSARLVPAENEVWTNAGLLATTKSGGGTRFYTASLRYATTGADPAFHALLLRSDDDGAHWDAFEVPDVPERASFEILAVDPTNEDRVVAMFEQNKEGGDFESNKDTILVSNDGGETFTPYFEATRVTSAMFDADGTLWVGDLGLDNGATSPAGLYKSAPGLTTPPVNLIPDQGVNCIGRVPGSDNLLLCHRMDFGVFDPSTSTYTQLMDVTSVETIRSCSVQDVVADCRDQLCESGWCGPGHYAVAPMCSAYNERYCGNQANNYLDAGADPDAGAGDGDSMRDGGVKGDSGSDPEVVPRRRDDCALHPGSGSTGSAGSLSVGALFALVMGAAWRRRSRAGSERQHPQENV